MANSKTFAAAVTFRPVHCMLARNIAGMSIVVVAIRLDRVGARVGAFVVGPIVGFNVGFLEGLDVGFLVGLEFGLLVGLNDFFPALGPPVLPALLLSFFFPVFDTLGGEVGPGFLSLAEAETVVPNIRWTEETLPTLLLLPLSFLPDLDALVVFDDLLVVGLSVELKVGIFVGRYVGRYVGGSAS